MPAESAKYAQRHVIDKLGVKAGLRVRVVGRGDKALLDRLKTKVGELASRGHAANLILYWPKNAREVTSMLQKLRSEITPDGAVWLVAPKKGKTGCDGMAYAKDADLIRLGLSAGLVDNKVCSISENESGTRFVIRLKDRPHRVSS